MEIDMAIRGSDDRRLKAKYENAIYVIQRAFALYEFEEVAFSFNGGKDSTVLLHLLRAGYFLHLKKKSDSSKGNLSNDELKCPMRTIYFESPSDFPEINSFTYETTASYDLQLEIIRLDFKSGLEALLREKPFKAIFLGTRYGDPNAVGQEQFSPSSPGWPPFMRVNPILDWSYRDVWAFLLACKVKYCSLYDQGYTSIGSIHDTVPNVLLREGDSSCSGEHFRPAYLLTDGRLERAGRGKRYRPPASGGLPAMSNGLEPHKKSTRTASIIIVSDEILFGIVEDHLGPSLRRKLHSMGWILSHITMVQSEIDSVADEVERLKSSCDTVFVFGGLGPLHSDVSVAAVAKAFGVRLAPDEELEEYLRQRDHGNEGQNKMAWLPEGITELLLHENLPVPLIKCQNVLIFSATNVTELDLEWDCLIHLSSSGGPIVLMTPFVSRLLSTDLADVQIALPLSKLCLEFPDINIGCYRKARTGPLIVSLVGKDQVRVELAVQALCQKFDPGLFTEVKCG
ncbi:hypothetical protein Sjap_001377 [Stephania japonica]|uniref:FAD synthase n=1 Tax=Stephania japonica TaxID=461633 RepID=A0AAP0KJV2_9MAGN